MPTIPVNLSNVEAFENLPLGEYLGQIDKIVFKEARSADKFPQFMVTYTVIDGDQLGRKSSEWLSLSPKAAFRLKKWFAKFGLDDTDNLSVGDPDATGDPEDGDELSDPDLAGLQVIFKVYEDKPRPGETEKSIRTALVSVEDELDDEEPAPVPKAKKAAPQPEPEEDDDEPEEEEPAPRRRAVTAAPKQAARPARRSLR